MSTDEERTLGQVKWFNNKSGYGFITVISGQHKEKDVFCHHSDINIANEHYKYLMQGEYVEFSISATESDNHSTKATDITGVRRGKLMCEVKFANKDEVEVRKPSLNTTDDSVRKEWMVVRRKPRAPRQESSEP